MKQFILLGTILLVTIAGLSCKKEPELHYHQQSYTPSHKYAPSVPIDINAVGGVMYTFRSGPYNMSSTYKYLEEGWAWFYDSSHSGYIAMDAITFNGIGPYFECYWPTGYPQPIYPKGLYHSENSGDNGACCDFGMNNAVNWIAKSDSNNISIDYTFIGKYPEYIGAFPSSADISNGLTLTLDSTTIVGADSISVTIPGNPNSIQKGFKAYPGQVNIGLDGLFSGSTYNVIVDVYRIEIRTYNNREFAFIKQGRHQFSLQLN